jgi:hypothetical protein
MDKQFYFRSFLVLAVTFVAGSLLGGFAARSFGASELSLPDENTLTFVSKLFANALFPALSLLLGTSVIGIFGLPLLCGAKGFSITFTLTAAMMGLDSASKIALLKFKAAPAIVSVTVMLLISAQSMVSSAKLLKLANKGTVSGSLYGSKYWLIAVLSAALLVIVSLI